MFERIGSKLNRTFVGNSNNKNEVCELCNQTFDWKHKQHSCKRCLRHVCYNCGPDKAIIPAHDLKTPHRICKNCKNDSKKQAQFIDEQKCKFGQLSATGKNWAKLAQGDEVIIEKIQEEYQKSLNKILKNASNETKQQIQVNLQRFFKENKKTLNYSLYDWNYRISQGESDSMLQQKISNVLHCFFLSNPVKLTKNLVFITTYILYFCDEAISLTLLLFLHQKVLPSRFQYHKLDGEENKPIEQEVKFLMDCMTEQSNTTLDPLIKPKIKEFLEKYSTDILINLMFNHIEFYVGYYLFNELLTNKDFSIYEKFLASICLQQQKAILELQVDEMPLNIIKNIQIEQLKSFLQFEEQQKRKHRSSLNSKDQLNQYAQLIIQQQQQKAQKEQEQQRQSINYSSIESLLESFIGLIKDNSNQKIESLITNEKYDSNKNQILELYEAIKKQKEELANLKNSITYGKLDQDVESEDFYSRLSRSSIKSENADKVFNQKELQEKNTTINQLEDKIKQQQNLIQNFRDQQQQLELDNFASVSSLKSQLQNEQKEKQEINMKSFEQKEENYKYLISKMHTEISNLKLQINNLQIQLQQVQKNKIDYESQLKEKIQKEYDQEVQKLIEERLQLYQKISQFQQQNSQINIKYEQKDQETKELKIQLAELKQIAEEMSQLCARKNEQTEKLNKHIDDLNIQIQGMKRKDFDQNYKQAQVQPNILKELQENNMQMRNNLLQKEKELFNLKQKFVEVNQLKIEYFDKMQNYERNNKEINQALKQYEGKEIYELNSFYEQKISLLEKNHLEQMNRLLSQFNQPKEEEQRIQSISQTLRDTQTLLENQKTDEQQGDLINGQTDDCQIF